MECGNLFAFVIERCFSLSCAEGYVGMITPSSAYSTERMEQLVNEVSNRKSWISYYDFRPSKLFDGVNLRLSISLTKNVREIRIWSTTYNRWYSQQRRLLFSTLSYQESSRRGFSIPKLGSPIESTILDKLSGNPRSVSSITGEGKTPLYFHDAILYWIRATDFEPSHNGYTSSHVKSILFDELEKCQLACVLINSTIFYWSWTKLSNCRDLNVAAVLNFPIPTSFEESSNQHLLQIHKQLMAELLANSVIKLRNQRLTGPVHYREFYPVKSKKLIDQIDSLLGPLYGLRDHELDYIINYDIKYRMGDELFEEED